MSLDRRMDMRVERAAVLAVERSILEHTNWITALPAGDIGIDLLAFRTDPFGAIPIQVKGAHSGLTVWGKYAGAPVVMAYVLDPLTDSPDVVIMSGEEAWNLPFAYVERGGRAAGHELDNLSYRWASTTKVLKEILAERRASAGRWEGLFEEIRAR